MHWKMPHESFSNPTKIRPTYARFSMHVPTTRRKMNKILPHLLHAIEFKECPHTPKVKEKVKQNEKKKKKPKKNQNEPKSSQTGAKSDTHKKKKQPNREQIVNHQIWILTERFHYVYCYDFTSQRIESQKRNYMKTNSKRKQCCCTFEWIWVNLNNVAIAPNECLLSKIAPFKHRNQLKNLRKKWRQKKRNQQRENHNRIDLCESMFFYLKWWETFVYRQRRRNAFKQNKT